MKIDKILFVSDSNLNYLSFWESISRYYKKRFGLDSKLFFIGEVNDETKPFLTEEYGEVEVIAPIKDIPIIIQTLWGKFWFTQTEPETTWLIGDIDLYLLNKDYFEDCMKRIPSESYGHINANGYKDGNWWERPLTGIPGYFHCAKGSKFKEFLGLSDTLEEDCKYIIESKRYGILYNGLISDESQAPQRVKDKKDFGYICCEENLTTERLKSRKDEIVSITYPNYLHRIETPYAANGLSTPNFFEIDKMFNSSMKSIYIDLHAPRPYNVFASGIEKILENYYV